MDNQCAVIIPSYKSTIDHNQQVSISRCFQVLHKYPIYIATYIDNPIDTYLEIAESNFIKIKVIYFDWKYFENIATYNKLMLSSIFYKAFIDFQYMLVYQDDAYVFKDELNKWCNMDFDYVGAPWVVNDGAFIKLTGVGNGGFSLRKVSTFFRLFSGLYYANRWSEIFHEYNLMNWNGKLYHFKNLLWDLTLGSITNYRFNSFNGNEDEYIGKILSKHLISIPTPEVASNFAFERFPKELYTLNRNTLPFGCHAWNKHDLPFLRDFIKFSV